MDTARTEGWDVERDGRKPGDGPRIRPLSARQQPRHPVQGVDTASDGGHHHHWTRVNDKLHDNEHQHDNFVHDHSATKHHHHGPSDDDILIHDHPAPDDHSHVVYIDEYGPADHDHNSWRVDYDDDFDGYNHNISGVRG